MQTLDVISVNLWQILISLANLVILFWVLKIFLFKPVKNILAKRESELEEHYTSARLAEEQAQVSRLEWEQKRQSAAAEADAILQSAAENAKYRGEQIIEDAKDRAEGILRQAEAEAALERKKASADIKREIVELSGALTEKMLAREINTEDHRALIDAMIEEIGDGDDGDQ